MAIPTISSIQPAHGPSSGQTLITIAGTGMRLLPPPPASGPTTGALPQTVAIRIGAMPATRVLMREGAGDTIPTCLTPPGTPGPADILLQNLDGAGQPIAGEAVLLPGAFTYERTALSTESSLTGLVRTLLRALKAQVIENVNLTVHTILLKLSGEALAGKSGFGIDVAEAETTPAGSRKCMKWGWRSPW